MKYKISYTKQSVSTLDNVIKWYNTQDNLGDTFKLEFDKIIRHIAKHPEMFQEFDTNKRRAVLGSSFPYSIYFKINQQMKTVKIIAVLHQSRNLKLERQKELELALKQRKVRLKSLEKIRKDKSKEQELER